MRVTALRMQGMKARRDESEGMEKLWVDVSLLVTGLWTKLCPA